MVLHGALSPRQQRNRVTKDTMSSYYVITPSNQVIGPCASVSDAQAEIPDTHDHSTELTTDIKACCANLVAAHPSLQDAEIEHVETWCREDHFDSDCAYLIFKSE